MDEANIRCLFHCTTAITSINVNSTEQLKDLSLYFKIMNISMDKYDIEDLRRKISDFYKNKLTNDFYNSSEDDALLKMLLLVIVIYILKSNDINKNSMLMDLCNKIPRDLHVNACSMFAPVIMRYSDGETVTNEDLDKCLKENNKENQGIFFSPIKTNERPQFPDQRIFASHKQKIHQSIKACRNYESFSTLEGEYNDDKSEEPSSLIKLVNYVQSPDYQTKKLMQCNRDLGKNVNELEYQLFMTSNFETELDKTLSRWKEKCKSLENKCRTVSTALREKEEEVLKKNLEIEKLSVLSTQSKRLEEKVKDYQEKVMEIQALNRQFSTTTDENKRLKLENHNLSHYYSLAKQRRNELETMLKDFEKQKHVNKELHETQERLSKTEAQLAELVNHMHSLHGDNGHDSVSETSFNNSFYNPEPMSYVVEKERDELRNELTQLKQATVTKEIHESLVTSLTVQLSETQDQLTKVSEQMAAKVDEVTDIVQFCQYVKEDKIWNIPASGILQQVKELFDKKSIDNFHLSQEKMEQDKLVTNLNSEINLLQSKVHDTETEIRELVGSSAISGQFSIVTVVKERLANYDTSICHYEMERSSCRDQLGALKEQVHRMKEENAAFVNDVSADISRFRTGITTGNMEETFSNPFFGSLYKLHQNSEELSRKYEQGTSEVLALRSVKDRVVEEMQRSATTYDEQLRSLKEKHQHDVVLLKFALETDFNESKRVLIDKHFVEEEDMKNDMEKLINDYQECLNQIEKMALEHEVLIKGKDMMIADVVRKYNDADQKRRDGEMDIMELNKCIDSINCMLGKVREELVSSQISLEENDKECEGYRTKMSELLSLIDEMKEREEEQLGKLAESRALEERYVNLQGIYDNSKLLLQQLNTDMDELRSSKEIELEAIKEESCRLQEEICQMKNINEKLADVELKKQEQESEISDLKKYIVSIQETFGKMDQELQVAKSSLEENDRECDVHRNKVSELQRIIDEMKEREEEHLVKLADSRALEERYVSMQGVYESTRLLLQQLSTDMDELRSSKEIELEAIKVVLITKQSSLNFSEAELLKERHLVAKMISNELKMNEELELLRRKETTFLKDLISNEEELKALKEEGCKGTQDAASLKFKLSKANLEIEKLTTKMSEHISKSKDTILDREEEIKKLTVRICTSEDYGKCLQISQDDCLVRLASLTENDVIKEKRINELLSSVESQSAQISSCRLLLSARDTEIAVNKKELDQKTARITHLESVNEDGRVRISEMNDLIEELERASRTKSAKVASLSLEIESCKKSFGEVEQRNGELQEVVADLLNRQKEDEIKMALAKGSILDFTSKIQSLESTIATEMQNYEKMSDEYRQVEDESTYYMSKYNNLAKEHQEEVSKQQQYINQLTSRIHRLDEERDDQIHEMEKLYNSKVFDLQQTVEDRDTEIQCLKSESVENRKQHKTSRVQLEGEADRLQKALQSRESLFHEEKSILKATIEKEREEKLKYKEGFEKEIDVLQNEMKYCKEKSALELSESHSSVTLLEAKINDMQATNYRLSEEVREKEELCQNNIRSLQVRVGELEHIEEKMKQLKEINRRLMNKLAQLENPDNVKEVHQLRSKNKSLSESVLSLERNGKDLSQEKEKMEEHIKMLMLNYEDLFKRNNDLKESSDNVQDLLKSAESRCQSRSRKIENYEREMKALSSDNEALKKRYLLLRDTNDRHKCEVERDHQAAVSGYIARIEALTNDVASFQEQMQSLTEEKNSLAEKNYSSKRVIDEQTSKLDGLQKLVWCHTENERRQLLTSYDESSRFTRMSHWAEKPQVMRQLPPVSRIDRQIVDSIGLNSSSRLRFESYVCSPYNCEDESSLAITKDLPLPPLPPRMVVNTLDEAFSQTCTPVKKKKDGIRLQISNRIRKSLRLDIETPKADKHSLSSSRSQVPSVTGTASSRPPPVPKKSFFSSSKSQLKLSNDQRKEHISKKECEDTQFTEVTPVRVTVRATMAPSTSTYSLFRQDSDDGNIAERKRAITRRSKEDDVIHYTQSAKTPKTNSVIKKLIRRSKNLSPKKKQSFVDSLNNEM